MKLFWSIYICIDVSILCWFVYIWLYVLIVFDVEFIFHSNKKFMIVENV